MATFIFGGEGLPKTPQELARQRAIVQALMTSQRAPKNVGEGLNALGDGIVSAVLDSRADKAESAGMESANAAFSPIAAALGGGGAFPARPAAPEAMGAPVGAVERQPLDYASQRVSQAHGDGDIKSGIVQTASALGIDPVDLATAISYETAGTFDPTKKGPTTQWGQHRGLIQFGEPQAQKYGVDWNNPLGSQLGADGAVAKYLKDTGVKPGMGLLDVYSAINAGGVGRYNASDANNGGAPGTVRDKVEQQMAGHRQKALALLGGEAQGAQVAQALAAPAQGREPMSGQSDMPGLGTLIGAMSNPWMNENQGAIVKALLGQRMKEMDPATALERRKMELEIKALENPQPKPTDDMREYEFAKSQGFQGTFQDWQIENKRAGATNVNVGAEKGYDRTVGEGYGKRFLDIQTDAQTAQRALNALDVMDQAMADPGFYSGAGGQYVTTLKRAATALGMNADGISSIETFNAMAKQAALDSMGGSLGTGFSNADRDFVLDQVPNLANTPEGNRQLIDVQRKLNQRKQQIAQFARDYAAQNNGRIDAGFDDALSKWAEANQLFPAPPKTDDKGPRKVMSEDEYMSLPSGAEFVAPDGSIRRKP
jgi:hypothetical protein